LHGCQCLHWLSFGSLFVVLEARSDDPPI
jgi:hypothetical protein